MDEKTAEEDTVDAVTNEDICVVICHLVELKVDLESAEYGHNGDPPVINGNNKDDLIKNLTQTFIDIFNGKYSYRKRKKSKRINFKPTLKTVSDFQGPLFTELSSKENREYIASVLIHYIIKEFFGDKDEKELYTNTHYAIYEYLRRILDYEIPDFINMTVDDRAVLGPKVSIADRQQKLSNWRNESSYHSNNITTLVSAYNTLIVTSSLIFTFGATLASTYSSSTSFNYTITLYLFQIIISLCVATSFFTTMIISLIVYEINRYIGLEQIKEANIYLNDTYTARKCSRISFTFCLIFFVLSLCVLFFDGVSLLLAVINTVILVFGIVAVVYVKYNYKL